MSVASRLIIICILHLCLIGEIYHCRAQPASLLDSAKSWQKIDKNRMFGFATLAKNQAIENDQDVELARAYYFLADGFLARSMVDSALFYNKLAIEGSRKYSQEIDVVQALNQKGLIHSNTGNYDLAWEALSDALSLLKRDREEIPEDQRKKLMQNVINGLGILLIKQDKYHEADSLFKALLQDEKDLPGYVRMYVLGNMGSISYSAGDLDNSLKNHRQCLQMAIELHDLQSEVVSQQQIGNVYYRKGLYDSTLHYFSSALDTEKQLGDKIIRSQLLNNIASVYTKLGKPALANEHFLESARIKEELGDLNALAVTYGNIGINYLNFENYEKAGYYFGKAMAISLNTGNPSGMAIAYSRMGTLYSDIKQYDSAKYFVLKSKDLYIKLEDPYRLMLSDIALAEIEEGLGNYRESLEMALKGIEQAEKQDAGFWQAQARIAAATAFLKLGRLGEVGEVLKNALNYGEREENYEILVDVYDVLWQLNEAKGRYDLAFNYFRKMAELEDSIFTVQKHQQVAELETIYETRKKEQENLELRTENEIKSLKIRNRNIAIGSMTLVTTLVIISLSLITYLYRKRTIAYKDLVQKNLELAKVDDEILKGAYSFTEKVMHGMQHPGNEDLDKDLELARRFNDYFTEEKPFLYSHITIEDVCLALNTNRTYLSRAIHAAYQKSFSTLVNEMRVRVARQMLSDKKLDHISLEGIGEMAGYNSRIVFYKNFKKLTGLTPSFYRESVKNLS
jgi:tetratricopeptide (TPR) repeat protein